MDQEDKPVVRAPPPYAPIKFLLSSVNTYFGNWLVKRLRNESTHPENPHRILGTTCAAEPGCNVPEGVRKVIDTGKVKFFEQIILNSDVIIYDLNTCDLKEAEFVISTLKLNKYSSPKTLICVSHVMTWARTKPKEKKEGDEQEGDQNPVEEPDTEVEGEPADGDGEEKKTYVRFQDKDYALRKSDPQYEKIKSIETLCMAAGKAKSELRAYIVCSGVLYGQGERLFAPYFMQARLQHPEELSYYGNGKNRIPMVHIQDLITYIQKTIEKQPNIPYILALDHNPKPTQKGVITAISQGIGTGKVRALPESQGKSLEGEKKMLVLNLRMKPTMYFAKLEEEEAAIEQQEGNEIPKFVFKWAYKQGIQKSIKKLCEEFNQNWGLKQTKVFIHGPPGSGKSYFSSELSQKYNLPRIHIKGVIEEVKALPGEFGDEIRTYLSEKKQEAVSEAQTKYDQQKQKWKKIPKELREPMEPFNPQSVDVRLPDQLVYKCYKWRLNQNDCLNRGYILDGYPRKYADAAEIFMGLPPVQEDAQPDENVKKIIEPKLIPDKFVTIEISDSDILKRVQNLPEAEVDGTHFNQKTTKRRLKLFRQQNDATTGDEILQDFFKENKVEISVLNGNSQVSNILEAIISPKPMKEEQHQSEVMKKIQQAAQRRKAAREEMDKKSGIVRDIQNEDYMMKKENEQNEERQILDRTSLALRRYLDANLVPTLSEGIAKILTEFPSDPVDRLAQFLFQKSLEVPNPDPSTFDD